MRGKGTVYMRLPRLCLLALPLALAACNANGARAQGDFNAAGNNLGQGHIGSGFNDIGQGFSNGANATGDAIVHTAHQVGNGFSQ
jgi:hypothetical protein